MPDCSAEFWTAERCYIRELLNDADIASVSLARARVEPGVQTQLHALSVAEWYVIESGEGLMRVADAPARKLGPGDTVAVPAGAPQQITNTGDQDLLFLCVCVPRFTPECYQSLE